MTSNVTIYHIPADYIKVKIADSKCCLNIIDSPGFGDTRGHAWDLKIAEMIQCVLKKLDTLDYLVLVVKADQ